MSCRHGKIPVSAKAHSTISPIGPRLLALREAAEYLGVGTWTLRGLYWKGLLAAVRFPGGRKLWFDRVDLDRLVEANKRVID